MAKPKAAVSVSSDITAKLSLEARIDLIGNLHIDHDETTACFKLFDQLTIRARQLPEPRCLMLVGNTGVGKSTILRSYLDAHQPPPYGNCIVRPVLYVSLPVKANILATATAMLDALEVPGSEKGTQIFRTKLVQTQLVLQKVGLVLIDETQHVVEASGEKTLYKVGDFFKDLAKKTRIPFVLAGMPSTKHMCAENPQLKRLTTVREIGPFSGDDDISFLRFRRFLTEVDKQLTFELPARLGDPDLARQILLATDGNISNIMTLMREAAIMAVEAGRDKIGLEVLSAAFEATLVGVNKLGQNPFLAE